MTACTNNGGSRARRAVTAALVGVLSVGAAPMVALATGAAPASGDVSLQAAMTADQIRASKVTDADDQDGYHFDDVTDIKFAFNNDTQYVVPTEITNEKANPSVIDIEGNSDYTVRYAKPGTQYSLSDGTKVDVINDPTTIVATGTYYACVMATSGGTFEDAAFIKFEIVNSNLDNAYICDKDDVDDKVIEYNGAQQKFSAGDLSVVVDGKAYNTDNTPGMRVSVYEAGETDPSAPTVYVEDAGDYVVRVTLNGVTKDIPFTVVPLDLKTADIQLKDGADYNTTTGAGLPASLTDLVDTINGDPASNYTGVVDFKYDGGIVPGTVSKGEYTYTVSDKDAIDGNVVNSQKLTVVRYEKAGVVRYNRVPVTGSFGDVGSFDPSLIDARTSTSSNGTALDFSVSYLKKNASGKWVSVDADTIKTPGAYKAIVTIEDDTYTYGGQFEIPFLVSANPIAVSEIYVDYKGETIKRGSIRDIYSGSDLMENVEIRAYDEDDELVPADALELTIKNLDTNKEVETVTETGKYEVTIKAAEGSEYLVINSDLKDTFSFQVDQVDIQSATGFRGNAQVRIANALGYADNGDITLAYTGEAIAPTFEYDLTEDIWGYKADEDWHALSADTYQTTYYKLNEKSGKYEKVDECVEPGDYKVELEDAKRGDNFNVDTPIAFTISAKKVFVDVPNNAWYSEAVYRANELGYIGGIGGTNMFAPMGNITRADVACVLYRMAGGKITASQEDLTDENQETISKFSDVDPNAYYAKAVAWTTEMGITRGYGDTFGSARTITTEEFATMLARYAEICGTDTSVDTDAVLAEVADGDKVSGYARDAVAWAVSEGYVASNGNLIDPQGTVYRARAVVIAVRYQPEALDDVLVDNPNLDKDETKA